jgi:hypothetical protein
MATRLGRLGASAVSDGGVRAVIALATIDDFKGWGRRNGLHGYRPLSKISNCPAEDRGEGSAEQAEGTPNPCEQDFFVWSFARSGALLYPPVGGQIALFRVMEEDCLVGPAQ